MTDILPSYLQEGNIYFFLLSVLNYTSLQLHEKIYNVLICSTLFQNVVKRQLLHLLNGKTVDTTKSFLVSFLHKYMRKKIIVNSELIFQHNDLFSMELYTCEQE
jgi:hypothetical protein